MDDIIIIESERFSIDWTYTDKNEIKLSEIWGFNLDWRWDSWHVIVVTKKELKDSWYYSYDLWHWVSNSEVIKLLKDKRVTIRNIKNYHNSNNFVEALLKITSRLWK